MFADAEVWGFVYYKSWRILPADCRIHHFVVIFPKILCIYALQYYFC